MQIAQSRTSQLRQMDWQCHGPYGSYVRELRRPIDESLAIIEVGKPAGDYPDPPVTDVTLIQVLTGSGKGHCDYGAGKFSFQTTSRTMVLAPAGTATAATIDRPFVARFFNLPAKVIDDFRDRADVSLCLDFGDLHRKPFGSPLLSELLTSLWDEMATADQASQLFIDGASSALLVALWRLGGEEPARAAGGLTPRQLKQVTEFLASNLDQNVRLDSLADQVGCSTAHFCRAFRSSTGMPPHRYQVRLRLDRAKELLSCGALSIAEVGSAVGYNDPAYFSRLFAHDTGLSPRAWRARLALP